MLAVQVRLPVASPRPAFGLPWVVFLAFAVWAVKVLYVPIVAASLSNSAAWYVTIAIVVGLVMSYVAHALCHAIAAHVLHCEAPEHLTLYPLGDAAHAWPAARGPFSEAAVAFAGPAANALLAALGYLVWSRQTGPVVDSTAFFLCILNLALALINLTPAFPFDGGRVARALVWQAVERPETGTFYARASGAFFVAGLLAWAAFLALQNLRFSLETSLAAAAVALVAAPNSSCPRDALNPGAKRPGPPAGFGSSTSASLPWVRWCCTSHPSCCCL